MGGVDKGLQTFNGMPLAQHTLARLKMGGGVGHIMVNANRNLPAYETFGAPVYPDTLADYAGPLAGFLTGFAHCQTLYLMTTPCDTPLFPVDLVARMGEAMARENADIAMAAAPEIGKNGQIQVRPQPVFCLLRTSLQPSLVKFTQDGGRKIDAWTALHKTVIVPFDQPGDDPRAFFNANTLAELRQLEST
jgi:molybdopterin-guanine dinucleotide biosynthesis protein A